ncbi:MAG: alpha/beta fold hydrolase [Dongiaceae bacterium]
MTMQRSITRAIAVFTLIVCIAAAAPLSAQQPIDPAVAKLGPAFVSDTVQANGTTLHYVRGGTGPAVILLHGFPQDWYEFHRIMPRLAKSLTVIAVDLRGVGGSAATAGGYDAANLAQDIHQLAQQLQLERVYVVGHDIGGMVAYAYARLNPKDTRGVMTLDVPLPGIEPWEEVKANPLLWHINFHQTPDLPEKLIAGRQAFYFRHFFNLGTVNHDAIDDEDVAHYASAYAAPEQLRAGFEMYRALPANENFNASQRSPIDVPLVMAGGDKSFGPLLPAIAETLRSHGWASVTTEIIDNSGHYLPDEKPDAVTELIERYAGH